MTHIVLHGSVAKLLSWQRTAKAHWLQRCMLDCQARSPDSSVLARQDYRVHIKHTDGSFEKVPYFSLPANDLTDVIAPSCYACFDYPNALADLVRRLLEPACNQLQLCG